MCISSSEQTQIVGIKSGQKAWEWCHPKKRGDQEENIRQNLNQGQIYGGPIKQGTMNMIA